MTAESDEQCDSTTLDTIRSNVPLARHVSVDAFRDAFTDTFAAAASDPKRDAGEPFGLRSSCFAARGQMRHAFPFRRILAGANMFNEMPGKGRGRRSTSVSQRNARRRSFRAADTLIRHNQKREQSC